MISYINANTTHEITLILLILSCLILTILTFAPIVGYWKVPETSGIKKVRIKRD